MVITALACHMLRMNQSVVPLAADLVRTIIHQELKSNIQEKRDGRGRIILISTVHLYQK
jgi:hypothetical protein